MSRWYNVVLALFFEDAGMLVEFSVENFRSIKDRQILSMLSSNSKYRKLDNSFAVQLRNNKSISLLPVAGVYGQNAAGKTNLVKAIGVMRSTVLGSFERIHSLQYMPFAFSKEQLELPSSFNIIVIVDGVQYKYGFVMDADKIHAEWLYADSKTLFTRELKSIDVNFEYIYKFPSGNLTGKKETWKSTTRQDALFLSTAVGLNSEQLKPIYNWFSKLSIFDSRRFANHEMDKTTTSCNSEDGKSKDEIVQFLKTADFYITDIDAKKETVDIANAKLPPFLKVTGGQITRYDIKFKHPTDYNDGRFLGFEDESDGTQKMYKLAGYWLEALQQNKVIIFDELSTSLHTLLVKFLVNYFNMSNKKFGSTAQLIFTTHDVSTLDQKLLDRDQIWFCERKYDQTSVLRSLVEYKYSKGDSSYEKDYLSGRYGAIPIINEG